MNATLLAWRVIHEKLLFFAETIMARFAVTLTWNSTFPFGVIQKLRGQDEVGSLGRWSENGKCLFLSTLRVKNVHVKVGRYLVKKGQNHVHVVIE